ncbi:MAG: biopolymer transporter ExbD [Endomicrobium sp.]|jgi:biopolymer transport protein ExbD|nr:biopolymer transporter ExbD [Endomicrobium sp.]
MKFNFDFDDDVDSVIDLTSLIDVLFLLLIFFILAATFASPGIDVVLAKAKNAAAADQNERIMFSINSSGQIYHNKNAIEKEQIRPILLDKPLDISIVFNVDQKAPFDSFLGLMDAVKTLGYGKFLINAAPEEQQNAPMAE